MKKQKLVQSWRWYGPVDPVSLNDARQAGAQGIVSALHHIPHGDVWSVSDIMERKRIITEAGLIWNVVESLPIHESIKLRRADASLYMENYLQSLRNLAQCGLKTVCYNFMPVLDWTRTKLDLLMPNGARALYFNWVDLAIFDLFIFGRQNAENDYSIEIIEEANSKYAQMSEQELHLLKTNILMGVPNEKEIEMETLRASIEEYQVIGAEGLRANLTWFLSSIADTCNQLGIQMTIHPDDPPYPILGLPRIASSKQDLVAILEAVDQPFNGICYCTGSLGAGKANNLLEIFEAVKERVNFLHLRNVIKDDRGNFHESDHLDGDVDMYQVMAAICRENAKRANPIPFRPDHGHQMLDDLAKSTTPGYSAIGRLRGLAELRGLELGIVGI